MKRLSVLLAGLVALAFVGAASASMVTITVNPEGIVPDKIFTVEWEGDGAGFLDADYDQTDANTYVFENLELSPNAATAWDGISPRDEGLREAQFLDRMLVELDLPTASDIFWDKIDIEGDTFTTNREYFWIKTGQWIAYFQNAAPGTMVTVNVKGGDFSHYGVAGVPIPAAFVLFGSGLVGLGWLARRQRARKEESVA